MGSHLRSALTASIAIAVSASIAACSQSNPASPTTRAGASAPARTAAPAMSPLPNLVSLVGPSVTPPRGALILNKDGAGPTRFSVPDVTAGKEITLRVVCDKEGDRFEVDATHGQRKLILGGGCDTTVIYTAQLTATSADSALQLSIGKAANWRFAMWAG